MAHSVHLQRRRFLSHAAVWIPASGLLPAQAQPAGPSVRLAAAWDDPRTGRSHVGMVQGRGDALRVLIAVPVPSRAHGVWVEPGGSVLFVARRPGDWLLRWSPRTGTTQWLWSEPDRRFTGHVIHLPTQPLLYTAETDLDTLSGLIVARDRRTLALQAEWPAGGIDPHQMLASADGSLLVAIGGIPTQPETGRTKRDLDRMESSLVRLDPRTGRCTGQWRLDDARLSIRHLARHADGTVGIALQAEHDDAEAKAQAPVLAIFDGRTLRTAAAPTPLAGYGGDIAATVSGFSVSVPRAGGVAHWTAGGEWLGLSPLPGACALATGSGGLWAGGHDEATRWSDAGTVHHHTVSRLRLDNHWEAVTDA